MRSKNYYIYILSNNNNTVLYIGVTGDLRRRVGEHKAGIVPGFTQRYKVHRLLYFEEYQNVYMALSREKRLKTYLRSWKWDLIKKMNPSFEDLYDQ